MCCSIVHHAYANAWESVRGDICIVGELNLPSVPVLCCLSFLQLSYTFHLCLSAATVWKDIQRGGVHGWISEVTKMRSYPCCWKCVIDAVQMHVRVWMHERLTDTQLSHTRWKCLCLLHCPSVEDDTVWQLWPMCICLSCRGQAMCMYAFGIKHMIHL